MLIIISAYLTCLLLISKEVPLCNCYMNIHEGLLKNTLSSTVLDLSQVSWRLWPCGGWLILEVPFWFHVPLECGGWRTAEKVKSILGKGIWVGEQSEGLGFQLDILHEG